MYFKMFYLFFSGSLTFVLEYKFTDYKNYSYFNQYVELAEICGLIALILIIRVLYQDEEVENLSVFLILY